ncbi:MAG TPA: cytochrome c-type biogenesis CcmF C-terminal domain-containing protein, partial [Anaerolineae bacterium]
AFSSAAFAFGTLVVEFYRGIHARIRQYSENALVATFNLIARNRRRYGGYIVHFGIVLAVVGIAGSTFYQAETQVNLKPGETVTLREYTLQYNKLKMNTLGNRQVIGAEMTVLMDGKQIATLTPEKSYYPAADQWSTDVAVRSTVGEDLYLILAGWEKDGSATLKVVINPLVIWLWIGFGVFITGTLIAISPDPREERVPAFARKRVLGTAS